MDMGVLIPIDDGDGLSATEAVSKALGGGTWEIIKADKKKEGNAWSNLSRQDKILAASNAASAGIGVAALNTMRKPAKANMDRSLPRSERGGLFQQGARGVASATKPLRRKGNERNPDAYKSKTARKVARGVGRAGLRPLKTAQSISGNKVGAGLVGGGLLAGTAFNATTDALSTKSIMDKGKTTQKSKVSKRDDFTIEATVAKSLEDKRQVYGWASITELNGEPVVDLQGDYVTIDVIEKAAHEYISKSRKGGDMHRRVGEEPFHAADLIESVVVTPEKKEALGLPPDSPTGWWVGFQVNDEETWDLVKNGQRPMFSIHGSGQRKETFL